MLGALRDLAGTPRRLRRSPGLTRAAVATLALGVGAAGAVFAVVDAVLLRPLPYGDASRLVAVFANERLQNASRNPTSPADFLEWRRSSRTLERLTAARPWSPVLSGRGHPEELPGLEASPELFDLLGVPPALGAVFHGSADEQQVVLSDAVWRRRFGGDPGIVGQSLVLDGQAYTVAGVMPAGFRFPPFWATEAELWAPLVLGAEQAANHDRFLRVFARLRAGATSPASGRSRTPRSASTWSL
jgi:hypothetical protein